MFADALATLGASASAGMAGIDNQMPEYSVPSVKRVNTTNLNAQTHKLTSGMPNVHLSHLINNDAHIL